MSEYYCRQCDIDGKSIREVVYCIGSATIVNVMEFLDAVDKKVLRCRSCLEQYRAELVFAIETAEDDHERRILRREFGRIHNYGGWIC